MLPKDSRAYRYTFIDLDIDIARTAIDNLPNTIDLDCAKHTHTQTQI